jgi:hypothetical protein
MVPYFLYFPEMYSHGLQFYRRHSRACKSREIEGSTLTKYMTLTNQLEGYCRGRGYIYLDHRNQACQERSTAGEQATKHPRPVGEG